MNKKKIKVVVIGAGSTYTPELVDGLISKSSQLNVGELALMDIDSEKLEIVGKMIERMLRHAGLSWPVTYYSDYNCVAGADYVLTQIRVGKLAARINDEKIPLKYGLIGQETCGIGGFFKALRTIPVMFEIAGKIEKLAPKAVMINFTNPSGIVAHALHSKKIKSIGLCNCPFAMEKSIKDALNLPMAEIEYVGLNHLSWITAIRADGKDYLEDALDMGLNSAAMKNIPANGFSREVLNTVRGIPSTYLEYYYFKQEKYKKLCAEVKSRGEVCRDIESELLETYKNPAVVTKPEALERRGGAFYSTVAIELLDAIENDRNTRHIINVANGGALDFMEADDIVEVAAIVGKNKITPVKIKNFGNRHVIDMMRVMKSYEKAAVRAAISGDKQDALAALLINPLCGDYNAALSCYDEMYALNKQYLERGGEYV